MARIREREQRQPPPRRRVEHEEPPPALLACGDRRTYDHREILYTACGTRVCDKHPAFEHFCRVPKHRNKGHALDP